MYRLLIVDDEKQIREGLKLLLPWEEYGIEICGEAQNGKEALELMERLSPHIVLLDIQMPVMNGLELAEQIRGRYPNCKFIVLSGYDDFSLVRQAMKAGAVDYLLKPCGREALIQVLEEIMDTFEDEIASRFKNDEQMGLLKNNVLGRVMSGTIPHREMREKLELLEMPLNKGPFAAVAVELIPEQGRREAEDDGYYQALIRTLDIFEKALAQKRKGTAFVDSSGNICMAVQEYTGWKEDLCLKEVLKDSVDRIKEQLHLEICVAVGTAVQSCRRLYESCQNARNTLAYKTVFGMGNVLYCDEIKEYFEGIPRRTKVSGEKFKELFRKNNGEELEGYVKDILFSQFETDPEKEIYALKNTALELIILADQCFDEWTLADRNELYEWKNHAMGEIMMETRVDGIREKLCRELKAVMEKTSRYENKNLSKMVWDAVHYIEEYYMNPELSLQYLADEFHTNTAYLGRMFRKETGSSFADYLNTFRVKKAEGLLVSTNYKGIELAEKVGFASYNYFYIVFKKITERKPMDVRRRS